MVAGGLGAIPQVRYSTEVLNLQTLQWTEGPSMKYFNCQLIQILINLYFDRSTDSTCGRLPTTFQWNSVGCGRSPFKEYLRTGHEKPSTYTYIELPNKNTIVNLNNSCQAWYERKEKLPGPRSAFVASVAPKALFDLIPNDHASG